jgi:hypothetical protein
MRWSTFVVVTIILLILGVGFSTSVYSDVDITATVTPKLLSITVSPTSVDYGVLPLGGKGTSGTITVTNNGTVNANLEISGTDATAGSGTWELVTSGPLTDQFSHKFKLTSASQYVFIPRDTTTTPSTGVAPGEGVGFTLQLDMPSAINGTYEQYTTTVKIKALET